MTVLNRIVLVGGIVMFSTQESRSSVLSEKIKQQALEWVSQEYILIGGTSSGDASGLVDKKLISSSDTASSLQSGGDASIQGSGSAGEQNAGTVSGDLSRQDILNMSVDEVMALIHSADSGANSSGSGASNQSAHGTGDALTALQTMSKDDLFNLSGNDVAELVHQMATSDSAEERKRANRQRWLDYVEYLATNPLAVVLPQDRSIDVPDIDENERWKLFLHDYGLMDFSEIGGIWRRSSVGSESVVPESVVHGSLDVSRKNVLGSVIDNNGDLRGIVRIKTTKAAKANSTMKLTVQLTDMNGKKKSRTVRNVPSVRGEDGSVNVPGWGDVQVMLGSDDRAMFGTVGANYFFFDKVGGALPVGRASVSIDFSSGFGGLQNVQKLFLPHSETFECRAGGKWSFDRASKVKVGKDSSGNRRIIVTSFDGRSNTSGIKLNYAPKTGRFKGSFKLYMAYTKSGRLKLKTKTVKISGFVSGDFGTGIATIAGMGVEWPVTVTW